MNWGGLIIVSVGMDHYCCKSNPVVFNDPNKSFNMTKKLLMKMKRY